MSWHELDCLASWVYLSGQRRRYERTGFREGVVNGQSVRVSFVPSSNHWLVAKETT